MAHELENNNMLYVGAVPWHGLGQRFITAPSIAEAIVAAGLDWRVGLKPLFTVDPSPTGDVVSKVPAFATFRETDGSVLGVVGPRYTPLQNSEAFDFFQPFLDANEATIECAASLKDGKRVFVLAKLKRDAMDIVKGDSVEKYILLSNSHDGTLAVRVGFTPIRVVCANTLAMAHDAGTSQLLRVRHSKDVKLNLEAIREVMDTANASFEATAEQYRVLASRQINATDLKKYIQISLALPSESERVLDKVTPLFLTGKGNDMPGVRGTYWAAYNAVTEYLTHQAGRTRDNRADSALFGLGATANVRALQTGLDMIAKAA